MFENQTYQVILQRMLDKVDEWARERDVSIDTREGSLIRTALSPAALEIQHMYIELDEVLNESFADTQSRDFLIRRCKERGITVEPATYAVRRGEFNIDVPISSRFSLNKLNYIVIAKIENHVFQLRCETPGIIGNFESGNLIPIDYIDGLTIAELTAVLIPGEDEEDTEALRQRYFDSFDPNPYGGNMKDYIQKTNTINGVGSTKVTPIWNGGGTVLITILNSSFNKASSVLIDTVQNILDPAGNPGKGNGVAPIGHVVTVRSVDEVTVNISTIATMDVGYNWSQVEGNVIAVIDDYLLKIRKEWATNTLNVVRISQIDTKILTVDGIIDVVETKINGQASNLTLDEYQIPVLGTVINL